MFLPFPPPSSSLCQAKRTSFASRSQSSPHLLLSCSSNLFPPPLPGLLLTGISHNSHFTPNSSLGFKARRGDRSQSLWPRQEFSGPYHHPTRLTVSPSPPRAASPTPSYLYEARHVAHSSPHPYRGLICPQPAVSVCPKTPLPPTNQQVSRCILRPLLSPGYKNR